MGLTFRHALNARNRRNANNVQSGDYFGGPNGMVTVQYPKETVPVPDHGRYRLHNEMDDCIVCDKCAKICPVDCIEIEPIKATEEVGRASDGSVIRLYAAKFDIDMAKCCYCGLCTTVCPTESLTMTKTFDYSEFDVRDMVYAYSNLSPEEAQEKRDLLEQFQREKANAKEIAAKKATPEVKKPAFKPTMKPHKTAVTTSMNNPVVEPTTSTSKFHPKNWDSTKTRNAEKPIFVFNPNPVVRSTEEVTKDIIQKSGFKPTQKPVAKPGFRPTMKPKSAESTEGATPTPTAAKPAFRPTMKPKAAESTEGATPTPPAAKPAFRPTMKPKAAESTEGATPTPTAAKPAFRPTMKPKAVESTEGATPTPPAAKPAFRPTMKPQNVENNAVQAPRPTFKPTIKPQNTDQVVEQKAASKPAFSPTIKPKNVEVENQPKVEKSTRKAKKSFVPHFHPSDYKFTPDTLRPVFQKPQEVKQVKSAITTFEEASKEPVQRSEPSSTKPAFRPTMKPKTPSAQHEDKPAPKPGFRPTMKPK